MKYVFRRELFGNWCDMLGVVVTGFNHPEHWTYHADGMEVESQTWSTLDEPNYNLRREWCEELTDKCEGIPFELGQIIYVSDDYYKGYGVVCGKERGLSTNCPQVLFNPFVEGKLVCYARDSHPNNCKIATSILSV